jgi:hypothetical protein
VALVAAGRPEEARAVADEAWAQRAVNQPGHAVGYVRVLTALGHKAKATAVLVTAFRSAVARPGSQTEPLTLLQALEDEHRADLFNCLAPELPSRLRQGTFPLAASACQAAIAAALNGGRS